MSPFAKVQSDNKAKHDPSKTGFHSSAFGTIRRELAKVNDIPSVFLEESPEEKKD